MLLLQRYSDGFPVIPGMGCGKENPFRFKDKLLPTDDTTKMGCTVIRDGGTFIEYYTNKIPGTKG